MLVETDREKYAILRIVNFYESQATDYADYFQAAWRFKHRSELGKPGPYAVTAAPVVRRWRVADASGLAIPDYSTVSGSLPAETSSASCEINVVTPGVIRFKLNSVKGLTLSVDGAPVDLKEVLDLDLKLGVHALKLGIDASRKGGDAIRLEVEEAPGSAGRVNLVGGK
jgi:hypothetical protein